MNTTNQHKYGKFAILGIVILAISTCKIYTSINIDYEEINSLHLTIPECEEPRGITSPILDTPEDLQLYLRTRISHHYLPFEGEMIIDSLDFANYDYIFAAGCPILKMTRRPFDDCSRYDHKNMTPVYIKLGEQMSHKVYIYKIKPKNKYRTICG